MKFPFFKQFDSMDCGQRGSVKQTVSRIINRSIIFEIIIMRIHESYFDSMKDKTYSNYAKANSFMARMALFLL